MDPKLKADVVSACRELERAGKSTSQRAVREAVGRGSYGDIGKAIESYKSEQTSDAPDWLDDVLASAASTIWTLFEEQNQATAAAFTRTAQTLEAELSRLRDKLDRCREKAELAEQEHAKCVADLQRQLEESQATVKSISTSNGHVEQALRVELATLRHELTTANSMAQKQARELGLLEGRLQSLLSQNKSRQPRQKRARQPSG